MILSLLFTGLIDACCPKKAAAYYAKNGKHCCKKCKTREIQNSKKYDQKKIVLTKNHLKISNAVTKAFNKIKTKHL